MNVAIGLFLAALIAQGASEQDVHPRYVGQEVCLTCHSAGRNSEWQDSSHQSSPCTTKDLLAHNRSYAALQKSEARHIAALSGLRADVENSLICLACHATGADDGRRWAVPSFDITDGVQCEACHGAGSFHVEAFRTSRSAQPIKPSLHIRSGSREDCKRCHIERPSHDRVLKDGFRLSPIDHDYKTPVNLAISPDGSKLFVVCERSESVIVIDLATHEKVAEVNVGARPHDIAFSGDGGFAYVTNRTDASVSVIKTNGMKVIRTISVGHEPHGIVYDPQADRLIVLNTSDNTVSLYSVMEERMEAVLSGGEGPWSAALDSKNGRTVLTSVRPSLGNFRDPPVSELTVIDNATGHVVVRANVPGANMLQGIASIPGADAVLFTLVRSKNLIPTSRLAQGWVITNGLGVYHFDGRVDQVLLDQPASYFSDPTDVAVSPDGRRAVVVSGGGDEVAIVDVEALLELLRSSAEYEREHILPNHLGMSSHFVLRRVPVGRNPRAVAFSADGNVAYVANALDDTVTTLRAPDFVMESTIELGGPDLVTHLRRGERLFHDASVTYGKQFSCRSCHPDGHINGLTFDIEADGIGLHPVDNRTLQSIFDTPPFKWEGTNPTLHRQCGPRLAVFFTRLDPYASNELDALVDYMCTIERPPNRYRRRDGLTDAQRRGKAVFERATDNRGLPIAPKNRCVTCHSGAYFTTRVQSTVSTNMWFDAYINVELKDLSQNDEFGVLGNYYFVDVGLADKLMDVPHLRNIADGRPYLHNGAANTLEEIWTRFNMTDRHGATADLTRQQLNDLIDYLKSL